MSSLTQRLQALSLGEHDANAALGPLQHASLVEHVARNGKIVLVDNAYDRWHEVSVWPRTLPNELSRRLGRPDQHVSHHSFCWRRATSNLERLGACYSDVDYYTVEGLRHLNADHVTQLILQTLKDATLPSPSLVLSTGRGLAVIWLLEPTSSKALNRWKAVQKRLGAALSAFGVDGQGALPTACCRLIGSYNSKSAALVRATYVCPHWSERQFRWPFDRFADEVLPKSRDELRQRRDAIKAKRRSKTVGRKPVTICTTTTLYETMASDLRKLLELRGGHLQPGHRNAWMCEYAMALSWLLPPADLETELTSWGSRVAEWTARQCHNHLSTILSRSRKAATGEKMTHRGRLVDPRYRRSAAAAIAALEVSTDEMRAADLRLLVDKVVKQERAAARKRMSRRKAGIPSRAVYAATRDQQLVVEAQRILGERGRAGSDQHLAADLCVSVATARMRVHRARQRISKANTARHGL